MVHQPANRRERRSEAWKNLAQVQADSAKQKGGGKRIGRPPLAVFAAVAVAAVLLCGGAYLTLSSGAFSAASVVRHVPSR